MEQTFLTNSYKRYIKPLRIYGRVMNQKNNLVLRKKFLYTFNHPFKSLKVESGYSGKNQLPQNDHLLIDRLKAAYLLAAAQFQLTGNSMWNDFYSQLHGEIHQALLSGRQEQIEEILRHPKRNNLHYGFDSLCRKTIASGWLAYRHDPEMAMDSLLSLCEEVGVITMSNPEAMKKELFLKPNEALQLLDQEFGFVLAFPNPFDGELGMHTERGIISYRAVQAVYQAWKIAKLLQHHPGASVLEIGGGLGRTAYYCRQFGISDYTIVDVPVSSLAQGNFLGRTIPENEILLFGEQADWQKDFQKIKLINSRAFFNSPKKYDLILNVDSLTELDINIARSYLTKIAEVGTQFLSINHEKNSFSIHSIWKEKPTLSKKYRSPFWGRKGYVEELFQSPN